MDTNAAQADGGTDAPLRLDVGAGGVRLPGYTPIDIKTGTLAHELPYDDGSVDEIRASHVLEHYSHHDRLRVLQHWASKLKVGGLLKVAVPDFEWICDRFNEAGSYRWPLEGYLYGGQTDEHDLHRSMYTTDILDQCLRAAGLCEVRPWKDDAKDCSSLPVSLNLCARKPGPRPSKLLDVHAVMSTPRLGFVEGMFSVAGACQSLGISITKSSGVFWGQCITRLIENAITNPGCKWVLTIDYDSVFTPDDVVDLWSIAERHEADAVVPVQVGRDRQFSLVTVKGPDGKLIERLGAADVAADVLPIQSGHFGLTFLRADWLRRLPKPWFWAQPDADGGWGDGGAQPDGTAKAGRIDDDCFFWKQAQSISSKVFVAPHVKIGHEQKVISWPDRQWQARHQYHNDYATGGKPQYARH